MAKVLAFKKYPDLLCNHEGAEVVNIGYCTGTLSNDAPYEAELWYDSDGLYMGIVMPYMESFGKMNTELQPKKALPKVINLRRAKEELEEKEADSWYDFSLLCVGMVDDGVESDVETIKKYVDFLEENYVVLYVDDEHVGGMKYGVNEAGNSVAEVLLVLKQKDKIYAVPSDEFQAFPNSCTTYDYRKALGLDDIEEEEAGTEMNDEKIDLPFPTVSCDYYMNIPKVEPEVIGFHLPSEPYGCFSNWFLAPVVYAGREYSSTEQYMMYQKVMLAGNYTLADKIMAEDNPEIIKDLAGAKHFHDFPKIAFIWNKHSYTIMKRGIRAKFMQHPKFMAELLRTGNAILVECAKSDRIWACGVPLHEDYQDVSKWTGENRLGRILMELRVEFKLMQAAGKRMDYIDVRDVEPIKEWLMKPGELMRIPYFHNTVQSYMDTLSDMQKYHLSGVGYTLAGLEGVLRKAHGGGYNTYGFYEMKQDVYDIARVYCY